MARDLSQEPLLAVDDIQGDILAGLPKRVERLLFFKIEHAHAFKSFLAQLELTSVRQVLGWRALIADRKAKGIETLVPTPGLNVAFSYPGLQALNVAGLATAPGLDEFRGGMGSRTSVLSDPPQNAWTILRHTADVHGVFIVTGASQAEIANTISLQLSPIPGNGWRLIHEEFGEVRPDPVKGHEHFGFADGVSQPGVRGRIGPTEPLNVSNSPDEDQAQPGQDLLWTGEFVFGYPGQDPNAPKFSAKGPDMTPPLPLMANGAFLVFRRLAQHVPEFNEEVKKAAAAIGPGSEKASPELLGAQMVGRWKSGAPIILAPTADDPSLADGTFDVNNFEFAGDRQGFVCPWAAHVRKAYPRNDVPGNTAPTDAQADAAEAFTQSHRMMRRGIAFGPELTESEAKAGHSSSSHQRGLLFKCYVTSIADQFEFVQQSWADNPGFSQPGSGIDPIIGQAAQPRPFLGAAPTSKNAGQKPHLAFREFVLMQGGEYFFAPAISAVKVF